MISASFKVDRRLGNLRRPSTNIRVAARNSINKETAKARRAIAADLSAVEDIPADELLHRQVFFYPANSGNLKGYVIVLGSPKKKPGTFDIGVPIGQDPMPLEQWVDEELRPLEEAIERGILGRIIRFLDA